MLQQVCWPAAPLGSHAGMPRMPHPTAASSTGTEGPWYPAAWACPHALGPRSCLAAVGASCMERQAVLKGAIGAQPPVCMHPPPQCACGYLYTWACTSGPAHAHIHTLTHMCMHSPMCAYLPVCLLTCVCTHVCIHSHVHITCMDTFTHVCVHLHVRSLTLVLVLPGMGLCSSLCTHMHVDAFTHVRACVHLCALTCVCLYSPHAAVCLHSACFQPTTYMLPMCAHVFTPVCACIYSYTPPLCTCAHLHAHGLTCKHPPMFPRQRACAYAPTHVYAPADACPCPLTRACAHTYLHSCTHGRACARVHPRLRVLTRVCLCHPAAGAALAPRFSQPCPGSWGCQACTGGLRCPGTGRGCQAPLRGARLARGSPGAGI